MQEEFSVKVLVAATLLSGVISSASAQDCHVQQFYTIFGTDNQVNMAVKSGKPCIVTMNARAAVQSSSILRNGASGAVLMPTSHRWGYQSRPGFVGKDSFVVEMVGTSYVGRANQIPVSGPSKITVDVDVVP